ncbi:unnamed protein product, partial [Sphagnum balticum]
AKNSANTTRTTRAAFDSPTNSACSHSSSSTCDDHNSCKCSTTRPMRRATIGRDSSFSTDDTSRRRTSTSSSTASTARSSTGSRSRRSSTDSNGSAFSGLSRSSSLSEAAMERLTAKMVRCGVTNCATRQCGCHKRGESCSSACACGGRC